MNWYIGQEIVAIESNGSYFKEGDEFVIRQLKMATCKCKKVVIDIGTISQTKYGRCTICKTAYPRNGENAFHGEESFAPKQWLTESEKAVEKLLQSEKIKL